MEQFKETVVIVLSFTEVVSSVLAPVHPIFSNISKLARKACEALGNKEGNPLDVDFQKINSELESISQGNKKILNMICMNEVNKTYGESEKSIKFQYNVFNEMMKNVRKDPDQTNKYMEDFKKTYDVGEMKKSLNDFYDGLMGNKNFGRNPLEVFFSNCDGQRKIMAGHCFHIAELFQMGLTSLMAYTAATQDDVDGLQKEWIEKLKEIQQKMKEKLSQCKDQSA